MTTAAANTCSGCGACCARARFEEDGDPDRAGAPLRRAPAPAHRARGDRRGRGRADVAGGQDPHHAPQPRLSDRVRRRSRQGDGGDPGRVDGLNGGKGGSWHLVDPSAGFQSTSAMVGGSVSLAMGGAFALKQASRDAISFAHFGDGTLDEGICYEAFNMASVFELARAVGVREQLQGRTAAVVDAGGEPARRDPRSAADQVHDRRRRRCGRGGGDVRSRRGRGAQFAQAGVRRGHARALARLASGHAGISDRRHRRSSMPGTRSRSKAATRTGSAASIRSCSYARNLVAYGVATRQEVELLDKAAVAEMTAAREFAERSPFPPARAALEGVFAA